MDKATEPAQSALTTEWDLQRSPSTSCIDGRIRAQIDQHLDALERAHNIRILYACESGSRGWGFASPDSDYDVRFLYVNALPWYLQVHAQRDVVELPISADLDINGWDLRKTLQLLAHSNPTLLEWLQSPIVYRVHTPWLEQIQALAQQNFSAERAYFHYVSMAKGNFKEHLAGAQVQYKKYLYVLRALMCARWIRQGRGIPPMVFKYLIDQVLVEQNVREEVDALLALKVRAGEGKLSHPWPTIHRFLEAELALALEHKPCASNRPEMAALDHFLYTTVLEFGRTAAA